MIAIFTSEQEAIDFSNKVHEWLLEKRPAYNADRWSSINKSDSEDKWMVKIPKDAKKWYKNLDTDDKVKVDKLPDNWRIEDEI